MRKLHGMTPFLLPVDFVMLKMMCTQPQVCSLSLKHASLFSGPVLPLLHPSPQMASYLPQAAIHLEQSFNTFFHKSEQQQAYPFVLRLEACGVEQLV
eukprot:489632-Pelagomonas_calceolata.AAC.1